MEVFGDFLHNFTYLNFSRYVYAPGKSYLERFDNNDICRQIAVNFEIAVWNAGKKISAKTHV